MSETPHLFFSRKLVYLNSHPGHFELFESNNYEEDRTKGLQSAIERSSAWSASLLIPSIPAADICFKSPAITSPANNTTPFPNPLIKVHSSQPYQHTGFASGVRSAVVNIDGTWYRLKGCGNHDEGFILQTRARKDMVRGEVRQIRGSAFVHTGLRELWMTSHMDALLMERDLVSANQPVGLMHYDLEHLGYPIACVVERTLGDRRLGAHLLTGLTLLLPHLIDWEALDVERIQSWIPKNRPGHSSPGLTSLISTAEWVTDFALGSICARVGGWAELAEEVDDESRWGLTWPALTRLREDFADILETGVSFLERSVHGMVSMWTSDGPVSMTDSDTIMWGNLKKEWADALAALTCSNSSNPSPLAELYHHIGIEAGAILLGMHKARISWGTYQDSLCRKDLDEWHCNAHANNYVVLPNGRLSYLDLDMAFSEQSYVDYDTATVGIKTRSFDELLWREQVSLLETLVGADSSTGVPQVGLREVENRSPKLRAIQSLLEDTLVSGFMTSYCDQSFHKRSLSPAALALVKLALYVTWDLES